MIRPIVTYDIHSNNNPSVLTEMTRPVINFNDQEVIDCVQDLNDTLDELIRTEGNKRGAIGLSATQIGVDLAITAVTLGDKRYVLINPELAEKKGKDRLFRIGCFSLYEYRAMCRYNDDVIIKYYTPEGEEINEEFTGDRSCVLQHEMDHLVGDLLFANLPNKEKDLFVPREAKYKDGNVALENHGFASEVLRKLNLKKVISTPEFYSSLFNDYTDYCKYVDKIAEEKDVLLEIVKDYTEEGGKILEIGNGTGALAVALAKAGYDVTCTQCDDDMLDLAKAINAQNGTNVNFELKDCTGLGFDEDTFETAFSTEILETLDDFELVKALKEATGAAKQFVFMVPTLWHRANDLKGNERLHPVSRWTRTLEENGFSVIESIKLDGMGTAVFVVTK